MFLPDAFILFVDIKWSFKWKYGICLAVPRGAVWKCSLTTPHAPVCGRAQFRRADECEYFKLVYTF